MVIYNKYFLLSLSLYKARENVECKSNLPMNDSTPSDNKTSNTIKTKKNVRPSKDTMFFLQLFARMYEPHAIMGVA